MIAKVNAQAGGRVFISCHLGVGCLSEFVEGVVAL